MAFGLCVFSSSCSFIVDVDECDVDSDCLQGQTCDRRICVGEDGSLCSNSRCAAVHGQGYVCGPSKTCIEPRTPECPSMVGPVDLDKTILLGSIVPLSSELESLGGPVAQGLELALEEINEGGGLSDGRRLALLRCNDAGNKDQGVAVARHLVEEVGVPVIFGPLFSGIFIEVTTLVSAPKGVMTISPSATSPLISTMEDEGLGWRTAASDLFQADALVALVETRGYGKLVAVGKDDAYGNGLLHGVSGLAGTLGAQNLYSRSYADPAGTASPDFSGLVLQALTAIPAPDAILLLGTNETIEIMEEFERQLGPGTPTRYLFTDGGRVDDLLEAIERDRGLLTKVEGTEADHQPKVLYPAFSLRFSTKFGAAPGIYAVNAYDAFYLVAFGLTTIPIDTPPTGRLVAESMGKLVDGPVADAGPNVMGEVREALTHGGSIDYDGASGPLDFDLAVGEAPANAALWKVEEGSDGSLRFLTAAHYEPDAGDRGTWVDLE